MRIDDWIQRYLAEEEPKSKSLIVTVFGDSIAPRASGIWLGELIELMAPFAVSERLVRTSAFRLVDEDWLEARRDGRRSYYSLTDSGARRLELAYERVYTPPPRDWDGRWTIVLQPRSGEAMPERVELRRQLEWEGFASPTPGLMLHPAVQPAALRQILGDLGLAERIVLLRAQSLEGFSSATIDALILQCWNLDDARSRYLRFNARFEPLRAALARAELSPQQAFMIQTLLIHSFRRVTLHDPRLPVAMLPADWPGQGSYALCRSIYQRTCRLAQTQLLSTSGDEGRGGGGAKKLTTTIQARFGGLG
ncbi:MAG: phenylacetic acid degradation operon negative regulatory protein PaaX [Nevskia sp.]